jgi:hypothetical protein
MLWYKSWMETRWRFTIGFALLMFGACAAVMGYPRVLKLLPLAQHIDLGGEIGRRVAETVELSRTYRGYLWSHWFGQTLLQTWALFAVLLGIGGPFSQAAGSGAIFTLSLPATRVRLLSVRAATAIAELFVLAVVPSLLLPLLSPAVGETYPLIETLVHAACLFVAGAVWFSFTFLLSTIFHDVWRPLLIVVCVAGAMAFFDAVSPEFARISLLRVMSAETYFRGTGLPWLGLFTAAAVSAALFYGATKNIARQDF